MQKIYGLVVETARGIDCVSMNLLSLPAMTLKGAEKARAFLVFTKPGSVVRVVNLQAE